MENGYIWDIISFKGSDSQLETGLTTSYRDHYSCLSIGDGGRLHAMVQLIRIEEGIFR